MSEQSRFKFIGHALQGDGPFRPTITQNGSGDPIIGGESYLIRYPRESAEKFARRVEVAFYASPLARITSKFTGYISAKPVQRDINQDLLKMVEQDTDGKGNDADIFWQNFMVNAKARGSMLLLVDMPQTMPDSMQTQLETRTAPIWTPVDPELLTEYEIGDNGKFTEATFMGTYQDNEGATQDCSWYFSQTSWACIDKEDKIISEGDHPLDECPLLIFAENGDYPCFGPFAPIADISKRLYNAESELDEILRAQTFSLLTFQVSEDSSSDARIEAAQAVGETIGTSNLMMHTGNTPAFIAPPDGPANIYMNRTKALEGKINEIGLDVTDPGQAESGLAKKLRFQSLNSELALFSEKMEGLEGRAWALSLKWLSMEGEPVIAWPRDFNIADPQQELDILGDMQATAMPQEVVIAQQKRVVAVQFNGIDMDQEEELQTAIDQGLSND